MTKAGYFDPFYFHEFSLKKGMTLEEVVDGYRYSSPYAAYTLSAFRAETGKKVTKEEFEALMTTTGQAIAARVFPLILGLFGGELEVCSKTVNVRTFAWEEQPSTLPARARNVDPVEAVKESEKGDANLYLIRQWERDKATLN